MPETTVSAWTDDYLRKIQQEAQEVATAYNDNPQYGGSIVAALCDEVIRLREDVSNNQTTDETWVSQRIVELLQLGYTLADADRVARREVTENDYSGDELL